MWNKLIYNFLIGSFSIILVIWLWYSAFANNKFLSWTYDPHTIDLFLYWNDHSHPPTIWNRWLLQFKQTKWHSVIVFVKCSEQFQRCSLGQNTDCEYSNPELKQSTYIIFLICFGLKDRQYIYDFIIALQTVITH